MADFQLKVTAETQDAEKKLQSIDKAATEVTRDRPIKIEIPNYSELSKNLSDLKKDIGDAANTVKQFYRVAGQLPVGPVKDINEMAAQLKNVATAANDTRKNVGDAGDVIRTTLDTAGKAAENLVGRLTRVAFSLYVINQAAQAVTNAFGGMFKATVGREIQLRETILKTQTTLASTNKIFRGGQEITDPYEKIVSLTGEVGKRIDSIRERSIALAGVTSNDVIEVFGIVASQVGQIGGGLKEAEDLAINFSAALGTFGIPLYQARQEIGSILRGDITTDSYLAKALGITNDEIAKAKTQAGGVVKFLEERLAASVAGQKIAAQGFAGVVSNIKDIQELVSQSFGRGLLDPLLVGLTQIFEYLFKIRKQLLDIAGATGEAIGSVAQIGVSKVLSGTDTERMFGSISTKALNEIQSGISSVRAELTKALDTVDGQLGTLLDRGIYAFAVITKGLADLAGGLFSLKLEQFKAMIGLLEAVSSGLAAAAGSASVFLSTWGALLRTPIAQEIAQIQTNAQLLNTLGIMPLIKTAFILKGVLDNWSRVVQFVVTQFNMLRNIIGGVVAAIGTMIAALGRSGSAALSAWTPAGVALKAVQKELLAIAIQLETVGSAAQKAGTKLGGLNDNTGKLGGGLKDVVLGMIKFNLIMFAVEKTLGLLLERYSSWKEAQDKAASDRRAEEALKKLNTTYRNVGDSADEATKRAKQFEEAIVDARYNEAIDNLEKIRKKFQELRELASTSGQDFGDYIRRIAQMFNPENFSVKQRPGETFSEAALRAQIEKEKQAKSEVDKWARDINKKNAEDNIRIEANNRKNMEQEIKDIRLRQENELFSKRQELAQKEVDIFRAAGELRIFQMEQANKKMMEGQEGASAAAMDALNTYLSARERGELEIEAAKKQLVVEVANMEREIENYKLENAKTIAKIRKESAQYEENVAKNVETIKRNGAQAQASPAPTEGFRVGSTGRSTGPHLDIRSPTGDANAVINEAMTIVKAWQAMGIAYIQLSNTGENVKGVSDDARLRAALKREQQAHATRARGGAIDIAVPSGTLVPRRTGTPSWDGGGGGWMATSLDTGNIFLHGLQSSIASRGSAPTPVSTQAPNFDAIGTPAVDKYAAAVRNVSSAMERLRALQAALTEAKTKAAFEEIAKAAFPRAQVEQYKDQLIEAQLSLKAFASSKSDAYDPDRAAIEVRYQKELLIMDRERKEIQEAAAKAEGVKKAELVELEKKITEQIEKRKKDLTEIKNLEGQILAITRAQTAIESLRKSFKDNTKDIRNQQNDLMVSTRMQLEGFSPEQIGTQMKVIAAAREYDAKNTDIQKDIAVAEDAIATKRAAGTAVTAQEIQTLNNLKKSLEDARVEYNSNILAIQGFAAAQQAAKTALAWQVDNRWESAWGGMKQGLEEYAASLGTLKSQMQDFTKNTLGAMSNAFVELLTTGTTNFRQLAANILTDLTRIIFQTMVLKPLLKALASPLGGGSMFGFASGGIMTSNGPLPLRSYAGGGIANSPQVALFGEGSKPEAFVPLPDGKSIPVSFDRSGATSSGNVSVNVNVDAKGTQAQGDSKKSEQIGKVIASAVQEEILRMKRPGGLLAS